MLLLRKIDHTVQLSLSILMLLTLPLFYFSVLAGLLLLGCFQLISAALNTKSFHTYGMAREIGLYWKYTGFILSPLFLSCLFPVWTDVVLFQWLLVAAVLAAVPLAAYYMNIYKKLIDTLIFRNELEGLIKSKH